MIEYNTHLLSITTPQSEITYNKAIVDAYNSTVSRLMLLDDGTVTKAHLLNVLAELKVELLKINTDFSKQIDKDMVGLISVDAKGTELEMVYALVFKKVSDKIYSLPTAAIKKLIDIKSMTFYRLDAKGIMHETKTTADALIRSIAGESYTKVKSVMLSEYAVGSSLSEISRKIKPFMTDATSRNIRTVVRTLTGEASQRAKNEFYDENSELIEEYLFVATLDSRTSSLCMSLDSKRFDKREGWYTPALHPNCRSNLISIPKGYSPSQRPIVQRDGTITIVNDKNFSFKDALKMFPDLNNNKLIDIDDYAKKMSYYEK